jgi:DNA-binding LacI/PurR family transcriptional regulator
MISHRGRITIKHVAKEAGVSTQTVSRVINQRLDVAPDTRRLVLDVIDRLGYHPSELARSLIHRRSFTLGVVTTRLKYIGPSRTLNGISTRAEELGYAILLKELADYSVDYVRPILDFFLARHVDGILWAVPEIGNNRAWLNDGQSQIGIPFIFLTMEPRLGVPSLSVDNYSGGVMATQHLLDQGHQKIAHLSGPLNWWEARQRKQAWQETLKNVGHKVESYHSIEGNWSSASGYASFQQLLEIYPDMDAIFVANDQMAISVLQIASEVGRRVPEDLAVVGFDDMAESPYFLPALTTIKQDQLELGRRAVQELVDKIELADHQQGTELESILISPELIVRRSSVL